MFWEDPKRIIDDFERSVISPNGEYTSHGGGTWGITDPDTFGLGSAISGNHSANVRIPSGGAWYSLVSHPGDGLAYYPAPGDEFHVAIVTRNPNGSIIRFGWAGTTEELAPKGYHLQINTRFTTHTIQLYDYGTLIAEAPIESDIREGIWYDIGVNWASDNTFTITLRRGGAGGPALSEIVHRDTTYTSRGAITYTARNVSNSDRIYFDNARVTH